MIILGTLFVYTLDLRHSLLVGNVKLSGYTPYTVRHCGRHEYAQASRMLAEDIVGAAADKNAGGFLRQLAKDVALNLEKSLCTKVGVITGQVEIICCKGEPTGFVSAFKEFLAEATLFCGNLNKLLVITRNVEALRQPLTGQFTAATELPSDCDNVIHIVILNKRVMNHNDIRLAERPLLP